MNLGRLSVAQDNGLFSGDPIWFPKKSKENPRYFPDNQLQEGKYVIGLQMGTNRPGSLIKACSPTPCKALFSDALKKKKTNHPRESKRLESLRFIHTKTLSETSPPPGKLRAGKEGASH